MKEHHSSLLASCQKKFASATGNADGPWSLAFTILVAGYAMKREGIVILEGRDILTSRIANLVCSAFPIKDVHHETAGKRGLIEFSGSKGPNCIVFLPCIDSRLQKPALDIFSRWNEERGYVHEYIDKAGKRKEVILGHAGIIVSCESTSKLPRWFVDSGWIIRVEFSEAQVDAIQAEKQPNFQPIHDLITEFVESDRKLDTVNEKYLHALLKSLLGSPDERIIQGKKLRAVMNALSALHNDGEVENINMLIRLLHGSALVPTILDRDEELIYNHIKKQMMASAKPVIDTSEIYALSRELGVGEHSIRNKLARLVDKGLLIKTTLNRRNAYITAGTITIDETRLNNELASISGTRKQMMEGQLV